MSFTLFGCNIKVSYPLVAALTAIFIFDRSGSALICCLAAFCHEMGHLTMMALCRTKTEQIKLSLFDVKISDTGKFQRSFLSEMAVILGGAGFNLLFCGISHALFLWSGWEEFSLFTSANLFLAAFNLMPIESLDGGNALYLLLLRHMRHEYVIRTIEVLSFIVLLPLAAAGFFVLLRSKYNFTLLFTSCYLMGIILLKNTKFRPGGNRPF